jgi:D-aspartate ligase
MMKVRPDFKREHAAFVLGLSDGGLAAVRSLAREGIRVIGVDSNPMQPGTKSRFCEVMFCPDPVEDPDLLLKYLITKARQIDEPSILYPSSDAYVSFVSRYRSDLSRQFLFVLPDEKTVGEILSKGKQYRLMERLGIPFPETFYPRKRYDIDVLKDQLTYPVFIKPYYSHLWKKHFQEKGFKANNKKELVNIWGMIETTGFDVILQSVISGPASSLIEVNLYRGVEGDILGVFSVRKLRQYPPEFGVGSLVESIHVPEVEALAIKFFVQSGCKGIANLEFKWDERDNQFKMLEANIRLWQQNGLAEACNINFPLIQYLDLTRQSTSLHIRYDDGIKWLDPLCDFQSFWDQFSESKLTLWSWLSSWRGTKTFATFAWDDPLPSFHSCQYGLKYLRLPFYILKKRIGKCYV